MSMMSALARRTLLSVAVALLASAAMAQDELDPDQVAAGAELYRSVAGTGCISCHGPAGLGNLGLAPDIRGVPVVRIEGALDTAEEMAFLAPMLDSDDLAALEAYLAYADTLEPVLATVRGGAFDPEVVTVPAGAEVQLIVENGNRSPCTLTIDGVDVEAEIDGRATGDVVWTAGQAGTTMGAYCADEPDARLTIEVVEPEGSS